MNAKKPVDAGCGDPKCLEPTHTVLFVPPREFKCLRCGAAAEAPAFMTDDFMIEYVAFIEKHKACPL